MEAILNHLFRKQFIIASSFLLIVFAGKSQNTTRVYGQKSDWAGHRVQVWSYTDYISKSKEEIANFYVSDSGFFEFSFPNDETRQIFIYTGAIEGTIFAEPKQNYHLNLPPYRKMTKVDSLNPFYQPYRIYLGLNNSHKLELNHLLSEFDIIYEDYLVTNFRQLRKFGKNSDVDTMITFLDSLFKKAEQNIFFKQYKYYKIADLKHITYLHDNNYVVRDYYLKEPVLYTNPAYFKLFNKIFVNYIELFSTTRDGEDLVFDIVRAKSYQRSMKTLANNLALRNDTLKELVLLKGLNDALYKNTYPKSSLFQTLDSVQLQTINPRHKKIAQHIAAKARKLRVGFPPPEFTIEMGDTLAYKIPKQGKKFILLNFIDINSFTVQKELPQLKNLQKKHEKILDVVSINVGGSYTNARAYFDTKGYYWTLLDGDGLHKVLNYYNVKAYPSYYLISPEGNLAMNPTPAPTEHFEWYFFKILKKRERQNIRNH